MNDTPTTLLVAERDKVRGRVSVEARRLDEPAPVVRRRISARGYGLTSLQASGIAFPTDGRWRVTAGVGGASITFVLLLLNPRANRPPAPSTQARGVIVDCSRRSEPTSPGR
jgi:hypothetical protein